MRHALVFLAVLGLAGANLLPAAGDAAARRPSAPPQLEINALVALYNATGGPNWTHHDNWLTGADPCDWYGVTCAEREGTSHVFWLRLEGNNLTGQLPPEIVHFAYADEILLDNNHLSGPLPSGWDNLDYIVHLFLNDNQFTGPIPADLGGISQSPGGRRLLILYLNNNQLEGQIPPELGNITSLFYLNLSHNRLSGTIPAALGNLTLLQELDLSFNQLHGELPQSLSSLVKLRKFILSDNALTGKIPTWFSGMTSLEQLEIAYNTFYGPIPDEISAASKLKTLWLGQNKLSGNVPTSLAALPDLVSLWVAGNFLEGELPLALINLDLVTFWFDQSYLCEPCDDAFLAWLGTIPDLKHTWPCKPQLKQDDSWYGKGGSYFKFRGWCWPVDAWYQIRVNNHWIANIRTDSQGRFSYELHSNDSDDTHGEFIVWVLPAGDSGGDQPGKSRSCSATSADDTASSFYIVDPDAPLLPSGGSPNIFSVPQGIGMQHSVYLPGVQREVPLSITLGSSNTQTNLYLMEGGDYDTAAVSAGSPPVSARRTGNGGILPSSDNNQVGDYYLQINAEDNAILAGNPTSRLRIEVEYLDEGTDQFNIQYDAWSGGPFGDGRFKDSEVITKTNSGGWRTALFLIDDAYFANRVHGGDFRIFDFGDGYETIRKVSVYLLKE